MGGQRIAKCYTLFATSLLRTEFTPKRPKVAWSESLCGRVKELLLYVVYYCLLYTPDEDKTIKHSRDGFVVREKQREFKRVD